MFEIVFFFLGLYICAFFIGRICQEGDWDDVD
jgi:hypothetical protein